MFYKTEITNSNSLSIFPSYGHVKKKLYIMAFKILIQFLSLIRNLLGYVLK